ncbi:glycosyltransferase family 2 protein [Haliea sp.]
MLKGSVSVEPATGLGRSSDELSSQLETAVLFLVFNRPHTTSDVFEAIRKARPTRLYIAGDGPRGNVRGERERVAIVREIATAVNWPCEICTLFRESNVGCKYAVSDAITWFFEHEERGIILEDDCLPSADFFSFCEALLERYEADERVWVITGDNFQNGFQHGDASYYFSRFNHCWGWATWRRAWQKADMDMKFWPTWKRNSAWAEFWVDSVMRNYWEKIFDRMYRKEIDTWDYAWTASVWYHGGLTATPNSNLVSNIGFGSDSTHTKLTGSAFAGMATGTVGDLRHPKAIMLCAEADKFVFDNHFGGKSYRFPRSLLHAPMRASGWLIRKLKRSVI